VRGVPTIIGSVLEVVLAYVRSELDLSSRISLSLMFVLAILIALLETVVKRRPAIRIRGDRNVIDGNVADSGDIDVEGSENLIIRSSSIPSTVWPILVSLIVFLAAVSLMILIHLGATWGFGQWIK